LSKKEKTVTRSFRVSESAFKALEEDAARRHVSLNTLVNQLFLAHTNWGQFYDKIGAIRISKSTFVRLLDASSDEAVIEAARLSGLDTPRAIMLAKHGELSLTTVLDYVRAAAAYGGYAEYNEVEKQGKLVITIMHNLGRKGSIYLSSMLESIFGTIDRHPKITSSEHSILIET
jgi:hypothetical protein